MYLKGCDVPIIYEYHKLQKLQASIPNAGFRVVNGFRDYP